MKKLVLTMVAIMAMSATSFAQYPSWLNVSSMVSSIHSAPISYNVPSVTYTAPSTINYSTTTVNGYYRSTGTYVESHVRTMPNSTNWDNYSTKGNVNPYTGTTGYRARDYSSDARNYGSGHTIYTGSRGGQYYYNGNGHKVYVPKRSW